MITINAIKCKNLCVSHAKRSILKSVSLQVPRGELFTLVGVNGTGKSTLIKTLLDFNEVDSGEITILDVPHTKIQSRKNLAYLPERFAPPYYMKGMQFLNYWLALQGADVSKNDKLNMANALDLSTDALSASVQSYSKGMNQKLGLTACLLSGKQLVILDEPMSGLDPKARLLVKQQLRTLKEHGTSIFFTSHLLADVAELADRMAILNDGEVVFAGTPTECTTQQKTSDLEKAFMQCIEKPEPANINL